MPIITDHDLYDEWLDEVYEPVTFGYMTFYASQIIKELDPIAYRVGFAEWQDMINEDEE